MKKELKMPKTKFEAIVFLYAYFISSKVAKYLLLKLCSQQIKELLLF